jgi:hypothetical protein
LLKYSCDELLRSLIQSFRESVWISPLHSLEPQIVVIEPYFTTRELKPPTQRHYIPISHLGSFSPSASLATEERTASQPYTDALFHLSFPLEVLTFLTSALRTTRTALGFRDDAVTSCVSCFYSCAHAVLLLGIYLVSFCRLSVLPFRCCTVH